GRQDLSAEHVPHVHAAVLWAGAYRVTSSRTHAAVPVRTRPPWQPRHRRDAHRPETRLRLPARGTRCVALPETGRPAVSEPAEGGWLQCPVIRNPRATEAARAASARRDTGNNSARDGAPGRGRHLSPSVVAATQGTRLRRSAAHMGRTPGRLRRPG